MELHGNSVHLLMPFSLELFWCRGIACVLCCLTSLYDKTSLYLSSTELESGLVSRVTSMKKWQAQLINYPLIQGQRLRYGDCLGEISKRLLLVGGWSLVLKLFCVLIQLGVLISKPNVKFMFYYEN